MKLSLQSCLLFILAICGNFPYQNENNLKAKMDASKEILNHIYLRDLTWNKRREKFSNVFLRSDKKVILGYKMPIKTHFFNKLSNTENSDCEFKIACNIKEVKILQKTHVLNNFSGNKNNFRMNSSEIIHSGLTKRKISQPISNYWNNTFQVKTSFKNFNKNILNNFTQADKDEISIYNMKPTKSSLFQYFRSNQPPVSNYFNLNHNFPYLDDDLENDTMSENYTLQANNLFDAVAISSSYETLMDMQTIDQKLTASSNPIFLEGSFTNIESMTNNIGEQGKSRHFQFSSSCNNQEQTSSGVLSVVSVSDYSAYSVSESESFSETDDSPSDNQVFTTSSFVQSSDSSMDSIFRSIRPSQSIYATSSVIEYCISRIYSSNSFDDIS